MEGIRSVPTAKAEAILLSTVGGKGSSNFGATSLNLFKNGTVSASQAAKNIGRVGHARLCYESGLCSAWNAFCAIFGGGPARTGETYVKILSRLGITSETDARLFNAASLTFRRQDKETGHFIFVDQNNHEVQVEDLNTINNCRCLTTLAMNDANGISELDLSGLLTLENINIANCGNLTSVMLPGYYSLANNTLKYLNVSGTRMTKVDISNCSNLQHFHANSCPDLCEIITGPRNTDLCILQACANPRLKSVEATCCRQCATFNLRDCPALETVTHPEEFDVIPTFHLGGCSSLFLKTRDSLNAIRTGKYVHTDRLP